MADGYCDLDGIVAAGICLSCGSTRCANHMVLAGSLRGRRSSEIVLTHPHQVKVYASARDMPEDSTGQREENVYRDAFLAGEARCTVCRHADAFERVDQLRQAGREAIAAAAGKPEVITLTHVVSGETLVHHTDLRSLLRDLSTRGLLEHAELVTFTLTPGWRRKPVSPAERSRRPLPVVTLAEAAADEPLGASAGERLGIDGDRLLRLADVRSITDREDAFVVAVPKGRPLPSFEFSSGHPGGYGEPASRGSWRAVQGACWLPSVVDEEAPAYAREQGWTFPWAYDTLLRQAIRGSARLLGSSA